MRVFVRDNIQLTVDDVLSRQPAVGRHTAYQRLREWEQGKKAYRTLFSKPQRRRGKISIVVDGQELTIKQLAAITGCSMGTARKRLQQYVRGEISKKTLLKPVLKSDGAYNPKLSGGYVTADERKKLRKIPGPGKFDALVAGHAAVAPACQHTFMG